MPDIGSDEELKKVADWDSVMLGAQAEREYDAAEEERIAALVGGADEHGKQYAERDVPPLTEPHDEYDPLPNAG